MSAMIRMAAAVIGRRALTVLAPVLALACGGTNGGGGGDGTVPEFCDATRSVAGEASLFLDFEDVDSGKIPDVSGSGRDAAVVGSVGFVDGWCGRAAEFDGTMAWIEVGPDPVLDGGNGLTVEYAFLLMDPTRDLIVPLAKEARDGPQFSYSTRLIPMSEGFDVSVSGCRMAGEGVGDIGQGWHHFAVAGDGVTTLRVYVDGNPVGQMDGACGGAPDPAFEAPLRMGGTFNILDMWIPMFGRMDNVAFFDHPRTAEQICGDSLGTWDGSTCARPAGEGAP